jgi:outer membrane protein assembly factor BamB
VRTTGPVVTPPAGASVLQFHNHINRDGLFVDPALTRAAAETMHVDAGFAGVVEGNLYASPLYVENGPAGSGAFYVATESNDVYALDESTGRPIWHANLGTAALRTGTGCGNIQPIGVTGTPAVDLDRRVLILDAATAAAGGDIATHTIHALGIDDGTDRWRLDVSTVRDRGGHTFAPQLENQHGAVLIVGGEAYVAYGGYSDCGTYRGWIVGVPLDSPRAAVAFASQELAEGIWNPGGPSSDGASVFAVTGNRLGAATGAWAGSECVLRLRGDLAFMMQSDDYWVPATWNDLDVADLDLGGSGALVVDAPTMSPSSLLVTLGKDGTASVLDRASLGGLGAVPLASSKLSTGELIGAPAWATLPSGTYLVAHSHHGGTGAACPQGTSGDLVAGRFDRNVAGSMSTVWCTDNLGQGSPSITTTDGAHNALVWTIGAEASARLHAWDLETGEPVFTGGGVGDQVSNARRFTTPIAAHGRILVGADGRLFAFKP